MRGFGRSCVLACNVLFQCPADAWCMSCVLLFASCLVLLSSCSAGRLQAKFVIHTVGPVYEDKETSAPLLSKAYK